METLCCFAVLREGQSSLCAHLDGVAGKSDMLRQEGGGDCPTMGHPETTPGVAKTKDQITDQTKHGHGPATHVTSDDEDLCPVITVQPVSGVYTVQCQLDIIMLSHIYSALYIYFTHLLVSLAVNHDTVEMEPTSPEQLHRIKTLYKGYDMKIV